MFNRNERDDLWGYTGYGAMAGGIICLLLFVYSLFAGAWNCLCDCIGGCDSIPEVKSWLTYLYVFLICTGIGFLIGLFSALKGRSERIDREARQEEASMEKEAQEKADSMNLTKK